MDKHQKHMNNLYALARDLLNNDFRFKIVACIVLKNKVISYGFCELKSHPFQCRYKKNKDAVYWHAETRAIYNALKILPYEDLEKCTLYVCRVKNENNKKVFAMAKPCSGCQRAINDYKLKNTIYSNDKGEIKWLLQDS